jgi:hypothetical protein
MTAVVYAQLGYAHSLHYRPETDRLASRDIFKSSTL